MNIEAKIEAPTTIRERVVDAFGFNEPSALDLVDRSKFADEDAFLDAAVKAEMERSNPEYRAIRSRLKAELRERTEREQREAQSAAYTGIRANVSLDDLDHRNIDALFDVPVCTALFGNTQVYARAGGAPLWFNFIECIINTLTACVPQKYRNILKKYRGR